MDTPQTSSPGDTVIFMDDLDSLRGDVQTLTDAGVSKIIALTHEGYQRDQTIAAQVPVLMRWSVAIATACWATWRAPTALIPPW